MIVGGGYGYGRALGAQGYGFAYAIDDTIADHDGKRRIRDKRREEEELMYMVAAMLPLIIGRKK